MPAQTDRARIIAALDHLDEDALAALAAYAERPETIPVPRHVATARAKALARDVLEQARRHLGSSR